MVSASERARRLRPPGAPPAAARALQVSSGPSPSRERGEERARDLSAEPKRRRAEKKKKLPSGLAEAEAQGGGINATP